jgi:hypothetical protein
VEHQRLKETASETQDGDWIIHLLRLGDHLDTLRKHLQASEPGGICQRCIHTGNSTDKPTRRKEPLRLSLRINGAYSELEGHVLQLRCQHFETSFAGELGAILTGENT